MFLEGLVYEGLVTLNVSLPGHYQQIGHQISLQRLLSKIDQFGGTHKMRIIHNYIINHQLYAYPLIINL